MATSTTHRFKAAFAHKDFTGFPLVVGSETRLITAKNLTDEDVPLLKKYGGGHLIESIKGTAETEGTQTAAAGVLQTAVETTDDSVIIKHSSGGPDDLPIEAPIALEEQAVAPDKKAQPDLKPAPKADATPKKK